MRAVGATGKERLARGGWGEWGLCDGVGVVGYRCSGISQKTCLPDTKSVTNSSYPTAPEREKTRGESIGQHGGRADGASWQDWQRVKRA